MWTKLQSIHDGGPATAHSYMASPGLHKPKAHPPRPREKPAEDRIPQRKCLYFVKTDGDPALQTKRVARRLNVSSLHVLPVMARTRSMTRPPPQGLLRAT